MQSLPRRMVLSEMDRDIQKRVKRGTLKINPTKTNVFSLTSHRTSPICTNGSSSHPVAVGTFIYLGSVVSPDGGNDNLIRHINSVRFAFTVLFKIWKCSYLSTKIKLRLFRGNVLYVTPFVTQNLQVFVNGCSRPMVNVLWQKWTRIYHTLRKSDNCIVEK